MNKTIHKKFIQALPTDNPYLSSEYIEVLKESFAHRPELLKAYLYGQWDVFEGSKVIVTQEWIELAKHKVFHSGKHRRVIACDPARFGDDETVIYVFENTRVIDEKIVGKSSLTDVAGWCAEFAERYAVEGIKPLIVVDGDGLGAGVADNLSAWKYDVYEIHSASKSSMPDKYYNLRAEMWWDLGLKYAHGDIEEGVYRRKNPDKELERQLNTAEYSFRNGKIIIEPKQEIKDRLSRSPDRADTFVMGIYGLQFAPILEERLKKDKWAEEEEEVSVWAA